MFQCVDSKGKVSAPFPNEIVERIGSVGFGFFFLHRQGIGYQDRAAVFECHVKVLRRDGVGVRRVVRVSRWGFRSLSWRWF